MGAAGRSGRAVAWGRQLIEVHDRLRGDLEGLLRAVPVDAQDDDATRGAPVERPRPRPRTLAMHCLAFCTALTRHHTAEDGDVFAVLLREAPELGPVIELLRADHVAVAAMIVRIEAIASKLYEHETASDALRRNDLGDELAGLAALLESHLRYEEKRLVEALDALPAGSALSLG